MRDDTASCALNPGVLYQTGYDLAERVLAAGKAARPFDRRPQRRWRDSRTGEAEWLTTDPAQLETSPRQRTDTLWARVASKRPAWSRNGEYLDALSALKRLWPTLFADEIGRATGRAVGRFVASTHAMARARDLVRLLEHGAWAAPGFDDACRQQQAKPVARPCLFMQRHGANRVLADAKRIPGLLDAAREAEDDAALARAEQLIRRPLASAYGKREDIALETSYGLLITDGHRLGAILSGDTVTAVTLCGRRQSGRAQRACARHAADVSTARTAAAEPAPPARRAEGHARSPDEHALTSLSFSPASSCRRRLNRCLNPLLPLPQPTACRLPTYRCSNCT
ncbi:MAG: hypothetical protein NZL99_02385 [Burkholderiaceae bacterium]|nr:hypothetical protein [Burkholderiaceae bacterium]